jgi:hypothetical protein
MEKKTIKSIPTQKKINFLINFEICHQSHLQYNFLFTDFLVGTVRYCQISYYSTCRNLHLIKAIMTDLETQHESEFKNMVCRLFYVRNRDLTIPKTVS